MSHPRSIKMGTFLFFPRSADKKIETSRFFFTKMAGAGNDFLIVDAVHQRLGVPEKSWPTVARAMCDRRYGVGADGLLVLEPSRRADCRMRIFNPDGSEAEMCGNGARCVASYVKAKLVEGGRWKVEGKAAQVALETRAGLVSAAVQGERVQMRMPDPRDVRLGLRVRASGRSWPLSYVDTGVPHAVTAVERVNDVDVAQIGRALRCHPAFGPRGTNVDFVEFSRAKPSRLRIRTYERGVEAETPACGTGVTAAAVIHAITYGTNGRPSRRAGKLAHRIQVQTRSGETLMVSLRVQENPQQKLQVSDVVLEGAVRWICQGVFQRG